MVQLVGEGGGGGGEESAHQSPRAALAPLGELDNYA